MREIPTSEPAWNEFNVYTRDSRVEEIFPSESCANEMQKLTEISPLNNVEKFLTTSIKYFIMKGFLPPPPSHIVSFKEEDPR